MSRKNESNENSDRRSKSRSNYFQTEFTVCVKKGGEPEKRSTTGAPSLNEDKGKVSISIQTGNRNVSIDEETPKERKKWVRPPLVGQASSGSDSQLSVVPVQDGGDDSDDDLVQSTQENFIHSDDYPNRKDYISEKPPEGSSVVSENRAPSPASLSSLTSARPLEWDSGADVGYFQPFASGQRVDELCSIELMALGGSASLLTRSDPEGTVSNSGVLPPPPIVLPSTSNSSSVVNQTQGLSATSKIIGSPNAESTPNIVNSKSSSRANSKRPSSPIVSHLFPEVIIERRRGVSSDEEVKSLNEGLPKDSEVPRRSSSLDDMAAANQPLKTASRSHSQNNVNFDMSAHLLKSIQPPSNSSSSLATIVKTNAAAHCLDKKGSESGSESNGRANSFEYLPGTAFEKNRQCVSPDDPLKKDVERGVRVLSDFMKGTNANNTILKKKLLKQVVDELLAKKYADEDEWASNSSKGIPSNWLKSDCVPDHPSTWQGTSSILEGTQLPARTWPVRCVTRKARSTERVRSEVSGESESQASLLARMDTVGKPEGTSGSTLESSSVTESSIKDHRHPVPASRMRSIGITVNNKDNSSSSSNSVQRRIKESAPIIEKSHERRKKKDDIKIVDPEILKYLKCERENQLEWIKKEIDHLSNLKRLLEMHESLRKNFDSLKNMRDHKEKAQRRLPSDSQSARPRRKPSKSRSEPLKTNKVTPTNTPSDCGWDSHDYGISTCGLLKKNASTNTNLRDGDYHKADNCEKSVKKPISYTIVFDCKEKENVSTPDDDSELHCNISNRASTVTIANRDTLKKQSRERILKQYNVNLQDELMNKKPDYVCRAEMRRQTVAELAAMREIREKNRKKILVAAVNGDEPPRLPNPLAMKRVVSQKSMRKLTEKNYKNTSLVKKQQLEKKKKEDLATNRLMAEMFNRVGELIIFCYKTKCFTIK